MKVDGLYFDVVGSGDPVVLLHAGGMDSRMWSAQMESLSSAYKVVRCDMRGSGQSERPLSPFSPSEDVVRVLDHLGLGRATLVGLSLGGRIALDVVLDHPERVSSLVLVGAGLAGFDFSLDYQQMMVSILGPLALGNVEAYVAAFLDSALGPRGEEAQPLVAQMLVDNQHLFSGDAAFIVPSEPLAIDRLAAVQVPTLVVTGEEDHPDILEIGRMLATGIAGAERQTVAGAAHMVSLDAPEEFNRILLRFLAKAAKKSSA